MYNLHDYAWRRTDGGRVPSLEVVADRMTYFQYDGYGVGNSASMGFHIPRGTWAQMTPNLELRPYAKGVGELTKAWSALEAHRVRIQSSAFLMTFLTATAVALMPLAYRAVCGLWNNWTWLRLLPGAVRTSRRLLLEADEDLEALTPWIRILTPEQEIIFEREYRRAVDLIQLARNFGDFPVNLEQIAGNAHDTLENQEVHNDISGLAQGMELILPPEDVSGRPRRGIARRYRASRLVRILRARVLVKFGRPKFTAANCASIRVFLSSQKDVLETIEAVAIPRIFDRVTEWIFNPSTREIQTHMALSTRSWIPWIWYNPLVVRRDIYEATGPKD